MQEGHVYLTGGGNTYLGQLNHADKYVGLFLPGRGNYLIQREAWSSACTLRRTSHLPMAGEKRTFPGTGEVHLVSDEDSSHFLLRGAPFYDANCRIMIQQTDYDNLVIAEDRAGTGAGMPEMIGELGFSDLVDHYNQKIDYARHEGDMADQKIVDAMHRELLMLQRRTALLEVLRAAVTTKTMVRFPQGCNKTVDSFIFASGGIMKVIGCRKKKFTPVDVVRPFA